MYEKQICMVNYIEIIDNPDRENVKLFLRKVKSSVPLGKNVFIPDYICEKGEREVPTVYNILYVHKSLW